MSLFTMIHHLAEANRSAQQVYDHKLRSEQQYIANQARFEAIERANYGRDAIDVEVRFVVVPLLPAPDRG